ncbi:cadherin EGF LAG seven-pass G-type receptor 1 isoform X1 [Octopus bimaculoides]|uniref:cadherin EGF LAG seven-pass G-type receptor 1 isoform X1 n=1 Tax=Octopus bimaculoides TaxID=37653 RepID=UPI00071D77D0|nr:cadherin EGF LAG seven-pass G-type receptor 1 isoform X1 [Octopus bimaculoides]XP_052822835.1 cadherin EGF LAG seven-pass G-type receptor 1 isoform X1 [Octopus bimaculoides]XP_052822836.1 cadherin EGF LAG seven-pass G-type receptor 1 isoform X1 [Octopus bimaculoides]|eukprot:XP_014771943.1 PREDICTED: cadherin EGF LAG seven-pass G-type receptor 1-like isoform X1 [Octopus bimaculoides]
MRRFWRWTDTSWLLLYGEWNLLLLTMYKGVVMSAEITLENPDDKCHQLYYTEPRCDDHPSGYKCVCGPGFHWNKYKCMSSALDSRLEFRNKDPVRYTLLLGKGFPEVKNLTIAFWVKANGSNMNQDTILSYKQDQTINILRITSGNNLVFKIFNKYISTNISLANEVWTHVVWTWRMHDGNWRLYVNGTKRQSGRGASVNKAIPSDGELVLGQASREGAYFDTTYAFVGDLSHFNIWDYEMKRQAIRSMYQSCVFMHCGNVVQWAEFRSGTRGAMRLRWPSGLVTKPCFDEHEAATTCDKHCSDVIGAQCNQEIVENIRWSRTPADNNVSVTCPGQEDLEGTNATVDSAIRPCMRTADNNGKWGEPIIDGCISLSLLELKNEFKSALRRPVVAEVSILELADKLNNHTKFNSYTNPIDIATIIDLLGMLVETQGVSIHVVSWNDGKDNYARTQTNYNPTMVQTKVFAQLVTRIVDNLLNRRNEVGWNATEPSGTEGEALMSVMRNFSEVISRRLEYHVKDRKLSKGEAMIRQSKANISFKIQIWWIEDPIFTTFPDRVDRDLLELDPQEGTVELLNENLKLSQRMSGSPVFVGVATFLYPSFSRVLPNHFFKRTKENNINTPVVALYLHIEKEKITENLTSPVIISLPYLDTFNISNPECVRLRPSTNNRVFNQWTMTTGEKNRWLRDNCYIIRDHFRSGVCACHMQGVYAITTDMYNDNWDKGEKRPNLMNVASYIGCSVSAALCLISFGMLTYLRTSSSTAALHKNLSLCIVFSQVVFMVGIDKYDYKIVCQVFAILLHYFFLATYSWIMNEAFNLYIVITYSAHSHRDSNESGSLMRYYIIGWIFPAVLVGAFVGSHGETYYAPDMCWIAWGHIWLFLGPAVGIIAITILVLIFTAKEHNENSYTQSEKTNKTIQIHSKALWTQTILLTTIWSFAFISLKMTDNILKYLYAMFNCLQGAFFIVFYFLLHEEVRAVFKNERKKKNLAMHGYDYSDEQSLDSLESYSAILEKSNGDTLPLGKDSKALESLKHRQRSQIEVSSDDASDCEMITSV